jgi:small subunit ribosomal protein S1
MSNPNTPESQPSTETTESFDQVFAQYERDHARVSTDGRTQLEGTVVTVTIDSVLLDIGRKSEGILPLSAFQAQKEPPKPGDKFLVSVKGRDPEGYYELSRGKIERPTDWPALEKAFNEKSVILGTVTGVIKGGVSVDVGVRAFMPASRSGVRDAVELEKMVGQEIRCRIIKLDTTEEDVVVDRRALQEEDERASKEKRYSELKEGDVVPGEVRSLADYGAFVDIGGMDGLLHVSDISWQRVNKPGDALAVGQQVEVKVLKIDRDKQRISLGMKQLQPHPWEAVPGKYAVGERVRGTVTRIAEFGAFVELEPGIEGLIHLSEMSWAKKLKRASDVVKPGEAVEAVILGVNAAEHRLSLGLKQTLGDPWAEAPQKFAEGSVVEGPITSITKFGAFVQLAEGVEGMIHVSEISAEKRINHPQDVLKLGQVVSAQVLAIDSQKRQLRLSMKQLVPTGLDEFIAEHKEGDVVTGRMIDVGLGNARVELGEGIRASCAIKAQAQSQPEARRGQGKADLSALSSMLKSHWKGGAARQESKPEAVQAGQVRSFRITKLEPASKRIEVELA